MLTKNFSGALQLSDLDDFIGPSQVNESIEQILSVFVSEIDDRYCLAMHYPNAKQVGRRWRRWLGEIKKQKSRENISVMKINDLSNESNYIQQKTNVDETPKVAKITLNDCLACSGCITSAESILIEQQDYREVQRCLTANRTFDRNVNRFCQDR